MHVAIITNVTCQLTFDACVIDAYVLNDKLVSCKYLHLQLSAKPVCNR